MAHLLHYGFDEVHASFLYKILIVETMNMILMKVWWQGDNCNYDDKWNA